MKTQRIYTQMSDEEQAQWVTEFAELSATIPSETKKIQRLFVLLSAWPFAKDFCDKAMKYGDYTARSYRLPVYIEKVKGVLASGLVMTDGNGKPVAVVGASVVMRRRGRPTREEAAARLRGEVTVPVDDTPESRKRRAIAAMLGLEVVPGEAIREKNNAELAVERAARRAEEERRNPSLFGNEAGMPTVNGDGENAAGMQGKGETPAADATGVVAAAGTKGTTGTTGVVSQMPSMAMQDIYVDRIETDRKLHMNQLAWLCSDALKRRIEAYHSQRSTFEDACTRAKTMAEMGASQEEIAQWTEVAEANLKEYKQTEADIDEELAVLYKRLTVDVPFTEQFTKRFKGVDVAKIQYITRPYYEKMRKESPEIDVRIKAIIEQDSPEYAARMKAEEEKKQELQALHRYIMRRDKGPSDERVKTMTERIERVRELAGDEAANAYLPVLEKTKADNAAMHAAEAEADKPAADATGVVEGKGDGGDTAEIHGKKATKQESKASSNQESKKPRRRNKR